MSISPQAVFFSIINCTNSVFIEKFQRTKSVSCCVREHRFYVFLSQLSAAAFSPIFLGLFFDRLPSRLPVVIVFDDVVGVLDDGLVGLAVVGRVGLGPGGVIAELGQHGSHLVHVGYHIFGYVPHPLGQGVEIHRLDNLKIYTRSVIVKGFDFQPISNPK